MTLIVEDGTGKTDANSYASADDLVTYASVKEGVDLSAVSSANLEMYLHKAMTTFESNSESFKGFKTSKDQALQWPRYDVWVDNYYIESNAIPREVEAALLALAYEESQGTDTNPNILPNQKGAVIREKVEGAVEVAYANSSAQRTTPYFAKASTHINKLLKNSGMRLVSIRS